MSLRFPSGTIMSSARNLRSPVWSPMETPLNSAKNRKISLILRFPVGGSCPHLLSWDNRRRDWTQRGKVLHEANDASREQTQTIVLPGFVSRFRLEEREPEVATIDDAKIALRLKNGRLDHPQAEYSPIRQGWPATAVLGRRTGTRIQPSERGRPGRHRRDETLPDGYYERYANLPNTLPRIWGLRKPRPRKPSTRRKPWGPGRSVPPLSQLPAT